MEKVKLLWNSNVTCDSNTPFKESNRKIAVGHQSFSLIQQSSSQIAQGISENNLDNLVMDLELNGRFNCINVQ